MGRKALHTKEQVFEAAEAMQAQGERVTASGLLTRLGGGSLTTIYKHLEEWLNNGNEPKQPTSIEMPENIKDAMENFWGACVKEANKKIIAIQETHANRETDLKRQLDEALRLIEQLETESEADNETIEALKTDKAQASNKIHELELSIATLSANLESENNRANKAEEANEALKAKCQSEKETLIVEKEKLQKELITKVEECSTEKSKKEALQNEIFKQCQINEKLKSEVYEFESLFSQAKAEKIQVTAEKETLRASAALEKALALAEIEKAHNLKIEEYNKQLESIIKSLQPQTQAEAS